MPTLPKSGSERKFGSEKTLDSKALEEVSVAVKMPKALHAKLTDIADLGNKSLGAKVVQAVREHASRYERTRKTVSTFTRKKQQS